MQQLALFDVAEPPVVYMPNFLTTGEADYLLKHCLNLEWRQNQIRMLGKQMPVPRLEVMHGDEGCDYLYSSSVLLQPKPWTKALNSVRTRIESATGYKFNIVLGNLYRDGKDSNGWHSDDESSMGIRPAIASLSLGSTRKFQLRPKKGGAITDYWLEHGSLLVMHPGCQEEYKHQVPKTAKPVGTRVNLTFRPHIKGITTQR